jgi:hypothetical protein
VARADPDLAFKLRSQEQGERTKQLELAVKVNELGLQYLGTVTDQPSYTAAVQRYNSMLQQYGLPPAQLPDIYSPAVVRQLMMASLSVKEQLEAAKPMTVAPGGALVGQDGTELYRNPVKPTFMKMIGEGGNDTIVEVGGGAGAGSPSGGSGVSRGERNNNPGNIEDGPFARALPGYQGSDGRFAIFDSPQAGVAAKHKLLGSYMERGLNTPAQIVGRWAPASENGQSTTNYTAYVAQRLGIRPDQPISPDMIPRLAEAMGEFETGRRPGGGREPGGARVVAVGGRRPEKAGKPQFEYKMIGGKLMKRRVG